ncbi:MAG: ferredoxin reductase [Candidatus Nanopelagicales bacterium]
MRRLSWSVATVVDARWETPSARTLVLDVPDWAGHLPGQHLDLRLTAADGYRAQRSYSIASAPLGPRIEITVQRAVDGEVSPYLVDVVQVGDRLELRGPVGGWFAWDPRDPGPVLLVGGGSGVVPLMAMLRTRRSAGSQAPFQLVYSVRSPDELLYAAELDDLATDADIDLVFTREAPPDHHRPAGRLRLTDLGTAPTTQPTVYVCGPTGFVESVATMLVTLGHDERAIRTERYGGGRA